MARFNVQFDVEAHVQSNMVFPDQWLPGLLTDMALARARRERGSETLEHVGIAVVETIPHEPPCFIQGPECPWIHYVVGIDVEEPASS